MWYVTNGKNGVELEKFRNYIILPMFEKLIDYKKSGCKKSFYDYLSDRSNDCQSKINRLKLIWGKAVSIQRRVEIDQNIEKLNFENDSNILLMYIYNRRSNGVLFGDVIEEILKNSADTIKKDYCIFLLQNDALNKKSDNIQAASISKQWKIIFVDFFYKKFLDMETVWINMHSGVFSRKQFHENFVEENNIYVCPYCDSDTLYNRSTREIEHFFPESIYPFLSMSAGNMFSACYACNHATEGKGLKVISPIVLPSYKEIGNAVSFKLNKLTRKIKVYSKSKPIQNYCELLNLEKRYSEKILYSMIDDELNSICELIHEAELKGIAVDNKLKERYLTTRITQRKKPLYWAVKSNLI